MYWKVREASGEMELPMLLAAWPKLLAAFLAVNQPEVVCLATKPGARACDCHGDEKGRRERGWRASGARGNGGKRDGATARRRDGSMAARNTYEKVFPRPLKVSMVGAIAE